MPDITVEISTGAIAVDAGSEVLTLDVTQELVTLDTGAQGATGPQGEQGEAGSGGGDVTLAGNNAFTGTNTISTTTSNGTPLTVSGSGAVGPNLKILHNPASSGATDQIGTVTFSAKDSAGVEDSVALITATYTDNTAGSEDVTLALRTMQAGSRGTRFVIGSGMYTSGETDMGFETINVGGGYYVGNANINTLYQPLDIDLTTIAAANNGSVLAATTASFTTADETKLDGIESGATADQSAAEILAALLTVDGAGSGLDADLLDGQSSAAFAAASHTHTVSQLSDATANGRSLISAANYAAMRTLLDLEAGTDFYSIASADSTFAPKASPTFTGTVTVPASNFTVGSSLPFADSAGTLTLQNVDALDATTEATVEAAIDTLANLTSVQGRTIALADAGADAVFGWDDSANQYANLSAADARAALALGTMATETATNYLTTAAAASGYQPLDGDLTSIAALTTTAAGRSALTITDPNADRVLAWDDSAGTVAPIALADITAEAAPAAGDYLLAYRAEGDLVKIDFDDLPGAGGGIANVVEDTTPQLGGQLDVNGFAIGDGTLELLTFTETASAVNQVNITNAAVGNSPTISAAGDDTNIGLILDAKGTGAIRFADAAVPNANDGAALGTTSLKWSDVWIASGGVIDFDSGDFQIVHSSGQLALGGVASIQQDDGSGFPVMNLDAFTAGANGYMNFNAAAGTGSPSDYLGGYYGYMRSDNGTLREAWEIGTGTIAATNGSESIQILFRTRIAGTLAGRVSIDSSLRPFSDDGTALGSTTYKWSDLFLASGGVINWNNGDVTATHSSNALAFAGASSGYTFDAVVAPASSDGAALGSTSLKWSDVWLASGAVVNFDSGNLTQTHSAGAMTWALSTGTILAIDVDKARGTNNAGANAVSYPQVNWIMQTGDRSLTNSGSEQKIFDTTTNGTLTLPTGVYEFLAFVYITGMDTGGSSNAAFDPIGAGTAVADRFGYQAFGQDNNSPLNAGAMGRSATVTQQTVASAITSGTGSGMVMQVMGMFRISTGGTIIPSITLAVAAAATLKAGSHFRISKIGESSETYVGAWT